MSAASLSFAISPLTTAGTFPNSSSHVPVHNSGSPNADTAFSPSSPHVDMDFSPRSTYSPRVDTTFGLRSNRNCPPQHHPSTEYSGQSRPFKAMHSKNFNMVTEPTSDTQPQYSPQYSPQMQLSGGSPYSSQCHSPQVVTQGIGSPPRYSGNSPLHMQQESPRERTPPRPAPVQARSHHSTRACMSLFGTEVVTSTQWAIAASTRYVSESTPWHATYHIVRPFGSYA